MRSEVLLLGLLPALACTYADGARCIETRDCDVGYVCAQDPPNSGACPQDAGVGGYAGPPICPTYCRRPCAADAGAATCSTAGETCQARLAVQSIGSDYDLVNAQAVEVCVP